MKTLPARPPPRPGQDTAFLIRGPGNPSLIKAHCGSFWRNPEAIGGNSGAKQPVHSPCTFVKRISWRKSREKEAPGPPLAPSLAGRIRGKPSRNLPACHRHRQRADLEAGGPQKLGRAPLAHLGEKPNLLPTARNTTAVKKGLGKSSLLPPPPTGVQGNKQQERRKAAEWKPVWNLFSSHALSAHLSRTLRVQAPCRPHYSYRKKPKNQETKPPQVGRHILG